MFGELRQQDASRAAGAARQMSDLGVVGAGRWDGDVGGDGGCRGRAS